VNIDEAIARLKKLKKEHGNLDVKVRCVGRSGAFRYVEPEIKVTKPHWNLPDIVSFE
jgi:hypothetical protein